ncbi:MAG: ribosomal RNA small subunit methyltransferase A [Candidatus Staskawiczbacteria bacterium]|nr:ribosomal RNA small subunit methyltransferase A [Candidatus Staskawiczbacteria bacterium]
MDLTSIKNVKDLLEKYGAKPSKGLGQNFLVHGLTLAKIIEAGQVNSSDTVLEIGPGIGTLTRELAKHAKQVIAIEKDSMMVKILKETLKDCPNVKVIHGDALTHNYSLLTTNYKLVANLPYYIASPVIRKFLETSHRPEQMVLMVQKEVAQRICANPPDMSILAISVQFYATAKVMFSVNKEKFWPSPKIDSAIIKIAPHNAGLTVPAELFFTIVKAGFSHPRKQLANNFSMTLKISREDVETWLSKNNLQPNQRAETLSIQNWIDLVSSFSESE